MFLLRFEHIYTFFLVLSISFGRIFPRHLNWNGENIVIIHEIIFFSAAPFLVLPRISASPVHWMTGLISCVVSIFGI